MIDLADNQEPSDNDWQNLATEQQKLITEK